MSVTYDEKVIVAFAERLYRRAAGVVALGAVLAGGLGAVIAAVGASYAAHNNANASIGTPALIVGAICALLGGLVGSDRAVALRLMAQTALCQVQIERNTRGTAGAALPVVDARGSGPPPIPRAR